MAAATSERPLSTFDTVGIDTPEHMTKRFIVDGSERTVLLLRRFDRTDDGIRVPYISAMTALEAIDGDGGDWVDLVDFARVSGSDPAELWRRAVFGCVIGNLDDHLRNHGFLRRGTAWTVAPAFDVNPEPLGDGNRHQLALFGTNELSLVSFMAGDALDLFGVRDPAADIFLERLRHVLAALPTMALAHGADAVSLTTMSSRIDDAVATVA